jgi:parallel beta-helix repeat protein
MLAHNRFFIPLLLLTINFTLIVGLIPSFDLDLSESTIKSVSSSVNLFNTFFPVDLITHTPIIINGNEDFIIRAKTENWTGDGNETTPFQISGFNITKTTGTLIDIRNTDIYFEIIGNSLNGGYDGIYFSNVTFGVIKDTSIHETTNAGVFISSSNNCSILSNHLSNCGFTGIWLDNSKYSKINSNTVFITGSDGISVHASSTNSEISDNHVSFTGHYGIYVNESPKSQLTDNYVYRSSYAALEIGYSGNSVINNNTVVKNIFAHSIAASNSPNTVISNNRIFGAETQGITVRYSPHSSVLGNFVSDNYQGIYLNFSENSTVYNNRLNNNSLGIIVNHKSEKIVIHSNLISNSRIGALEFAYEAGNTLSYHNTVINSSYYQLFFDSSSNNTIIFNDFFDNDQYYSSQGYDNGNTGLKNNVSHNFWNDLNTPDVNSDGVVDTPYLMNGGSNNQDSHPLTEPVHTVTPPTIIFPNGNETLNGSIDLQWSSSLDSLGFDIVYSIFYSSDFGKNWVVLTSDIQDTELLLDTTKLSDGTSYLIKVIASSDTMKGLTNYDISDGSFIINNTAPITSSTTVQESTNSLLFLELIVICVVISVKQSQKKRRKYE